jgi:hypothetical protein
VAALDPTEGSDAPRRAGNGNGEAVWKKPAGRRHVKNLGVLWENGGLVPVSFIGNGGFVPVFYRKMVVLYQFL